MNKLYRVMGSYSADKFELKVVEWNVIKETDKQIKVLKPFCNSNMEKTIKKDLVGVIDTAIREDLYKHIQYCVWASDGNLEECKKAIKEKIVAELEKRESVAREMRKALDEGFVELIDVE